MVEVTGDKPILAVRVVDTNGKAHSHSPMEMSQNIFGTDGADLVNLNSQLRACSFNQLRINPGEIAAEHKLAPGVIQVDIDIDIAGGSDRYAIHNAVTTAVQAQLGHNLPGPYQHVMYMLEVRLFFTFTMTLGFLYYHACSYLTLCAVCGPF